MIVVVFLLVLIPSCNHFDNFSIERTDYNAKYYSQIGLNIDKLNIKQKDINRIKVGIIDTGFDMNNSYINVIPINNIEENAAKANHGNIVAGIIASKENKETGFKGIIPGIDLYAYNITYQNMNSKHLITAFKRLILEDVDVINISLSTNKFDEEFFRVVKLAVDSGISVVASSGNSAIDSPQYPASFDIEGLISVGALDSSNNVYNSSTLNKQVDIWAPGESVYSFDNMNIELIKAYNGTSVATPIVTSLVILIKSKFPNLTPSQIGTILKNGAYLFRGMWGVKKVNIYLVDFQRTLILCEEFQNTRRKSYG